MRICSAGYLLKTLIAAAFIMGVHSSAPALFQYGLQDEAWAPLKDAKDYFAMSSGPKEAKFYESGHALNVQARVDRFEFLRQHLALLPLSHGTLESIVNTK